MFAASKSSKSFKVFATFRKAGNSAAFVWCACENLFCFQVVFKAFVKWLKNSFHAHLYFKQNDAAIATSILDQLLSAFMVPVSSSAPSAYKILQNTVNFYQHNHLRSLTTFCWINVKAKNWKTMTYLLWSRVAFHLRREALCRLRSEFAPNASAARSEVSMTASLHAAATFYPTRYHFRHFCDLHPGLYEYENKLWKPRAKPCVDFWPQ